MKSGNPMPLEASGSEGVKKVLETVQVNSQEVTTMITVACFCGCTYSIAGDRGPCPQCGERITFRRTRVAEGHDGQDCDRKEPRRPLVRRAGADERSRLAARSEHERKERDSTEDILNIASKRRS